MKLQEIELDSEALGVAGTLRITSFRQGTPVSFSRTFPNKVVSSVGYGRNLIARALAGDSTYPIGVTSASIGTGNTAAADGDTDLETPTVTGVSITNITVTNNIVQVDVFISDALLPNGTYKEFGLFCDGQLFARVLISPNYTKVSGEDSLFSYTLNISG